MGVVQGDVLRVGAPLSLSGPYAVQGSQAERGLRLWVEDVNAAGGLPIGSQQYPLFLLALDDGGLPSRAAELVDRLIERDEVGLLFSPYGSGLVVAAACVAERRGRVLWNHGGSSDALAHQGYRYLVSVPSPASAYFVPLLELAREWAPDARRVALVYDARGTFGRAVAGGARSAARELGLEVCLELAYPDDAGRYGLLAEQLVAVGPALALLAGRLEQDVAFARLLCSAAPDVALGAVGAGVVSFGEQLGRLAEGVFGPSQWEPGARYVPDLGPTSRQFARRFRARFGLEPDYPAAQAYAAGLVAQRCVAIAGSLQDERLLDVARRLRLTTFYGDFALDPASGRQVGHCLLVVQWQRERRRIVWPPRHACASPRFRTGTARPAK